jgi:hypothetical protein
MGWIRSAGRRFGVLTIAGCALLVGTSAHAGATKCRAAIVKGTGTIVAARAIALARCWDAVAAGKRPGPCPDVKAEGVIGKARAKLESGIAKACGGADEQCGAGTAQDETLNSIGWNVGSCATFGNALCANTIADCNDVATCVRCLGERSVDQAVALYYDPAALAAASDKRLRACLRAIGKSGAASLRLVSQRLAACWLGVNKSDSGGSFSCPDVRASLATAKARANSLAVICKRCGGSNRQCGDADDVPLASIGFPSTCPALGACSGAVQTLPDLAGCVSCVTGALMDGTVRSAIPAFSSTSPPQCVPVPTVTPGG